MVKLSWLGIFFLLAITINLIIFPTIITATLQDLTQTLSTSNIQLTSLTQSPSHKLVVLPIDINSPYIDMIVVVRCIDAPTFCRMNSPWVFKGIPPIGCKGVEKQPEYMISVDWYDGVTYEPLLQTKEVEFSPIRHFPQPWTTIPSTRVPDILIGFAEVRSLTPCPTWQSTYTQTTDSCSFTIDNVPIESLFAMTKYPARHALGSSNVEENNFILGNVITDEYKLNPDSYDHYFTYNFNFGGINLGAWDAYHPVFHIIPHGFLQLGEIPDITEMMSHFQCHINDYANIGHTTWHLDERDGLWKLIFKPEGLSEIAPRLLPYSKWSHNIQCRLNIRGNIYALRKLLPDRFTGDNKIQGVSLMVLNENIFARTSLVVFSPRVKHTPLIFGINYPETTYFDPYFVDGQLIRFVQNLNLPTKPWVSIARLQYNIRQVNGARRFDLDLYLSGRPRSIYISDIHHNVAASTTLQPIYYVFCKNQVLAFGNTTLIVTRNGLYKEHLFQLQPPTYLPDYNNLISRCDDVSDTIHKPTITLYISYTIESIETPVPPTSDATTKESLLDSTYTLLSHTDLLQIIDINEAVYTPQIKYFFLTLVPGRNSTTTQFLYNFELKPFTSLIPPYEELSNTYDFSHLEFDLSGYFDGFNVTTLVSYTLHLHGFGWEFGLESDPTQLGEVCSAIGNKDDGTEWKTPVDIVYQYRNKAVPYPLTIRFEARGRNHLQKFHLTCTGLFIRHLTGFDDKLFINSTQFQITLTAESIQYPQESNLFAPFIQFFDLNPPKEPKNSKMTIIIVAVSVTGGVALLAIVVTLLLKFVVAKPKQENQNELLIHPEATYVNFE